MAVGFFRVKELEADLSEEQKQLAKSEQSQSLLSQTIRMEMDVLLETAGSGFDTKFDSNMGSDDLLTDIPVSSDWIIP